MITAALIGNPNSGKTTVFNKLTGSIQHVGNWPGVTVERKQGFIRGATDEKILVVDLPGIYSLSPYTPEEVVSRDYLIGTADDKPDAVINILDASNLERGLYLLTQVADLGLPMVVVLNMMDVADRSGMKIDSKKLSETLGCEVIETVGIKALGTGEIASAVQKAVREKRSARKITYSAEIEGCIVELEPILEKKVREDILRWVAIKMIESDEKVISDLDEEDVSACSEIVSRFELKVRDDGVQAVATARYAAGSEIQKSCLVKAKDSMSGNRLSDKIDRILLHRILAIPIFIAVMYIVYWIAIDKVGGWGSDYINDEFVPWVQERLGEILEDAGVDSTLNDLIISGIVGGVGAVLGFLPLIIVLFFLLALLEECGYMARVAYILDRIFTRFGLSGKAIIPAVIGIGCGVPGIMSTRTIENESNRTVSVVTTTFMPCGAKLPILTIIIGAFFGASAAVTLSIYLLGIVMILLSGIILQKFSGFVGNASPFIMELPIYHAPTVRNVVTGVTEKSWAFVRKAGTLILLSAVIIWVLSSFDWNFEYLGDGEINGSMLSDIGEAITWIFLPNGFGNHWEFSVATMTGLMAKENLLATVAVLLDCSVDAENMPTEEAIATFCTQGEAMSFLIFNCLCAPCFAAIGAMHRELISWKRTGLAVLYQCSVAYAVSCIYYQVWCVLEGHIGIGLIAAAVFIVIPLYLIVAKDPVGAFRRRSASSGEVE